MLGKHKGVATLIKQRNPNTYIAGSPCHLMHLAAQKGGKCLQYQIDELLVDIWYYIDKSQLRHQAIINIQQEHGIEVRKILKHVSTRWLSLGKAIKRLLENWDVLLDYFKSESALHTRKRKAPSSDLPGKTAKKSKTEIPNKNTRIPFTKTKKVQQRTLPYHLLRSNLTSTDICLISKSKRHSWAKKKESLLSQKSIKKSTASVSGSETQRPHKTKLIYCQLNDPNCKLHAMFLNAILPFFDHAYEVLQKDEPQIDFVHDVLIDQLSSILSRFLKPDVILAAKDITMLDLSNENNHKADCDIQIGHECKVFLTQNKDMLYVIAFYTCVKNFYVAECEYMIMHYPCNDELLLNAKIVDIADRTQVKFSSVEYFVKHFDLVPKESMDQLESEFNQYQIDKNIVANKEIRIDQQWHSIGQIKDQATSEKKYPVLASVMKTVLLIFHSNADCERVFSVVKKNKTKQRANSPGDQFPEIGCRNCYQEYYYNAVDGGTLTCSFSVARPAVRLEWFEQRGDGYERLEMQQFDIAENSNGTFNSLATLKSFTASSNLIHLVICRSTWSLSDWKREKEAVVDYSSHESFADLTPHLQHMEINRYAKIKCGRPSSAYIIWKRILYSNEPAIIGYHLHGLTKTISDIPDVELSAEGSLIFASPKVQHEGMYVCISGDGQKEEIQMTSLEVLIPPSPPYIQIAGCNNVSQRCVIREDSTKNLTCAVYGARPSVTLEWIAAAGDEISFFNHKVFKERGETFDTILSVEYKVSQDIICGTEILIKSSCKENELREEHGHGGGIVIAVVVLYVFMTGSFCVC
ncbi:hypothetical protein HOLleu_23642 [Holothuria leucospilota]|uniref:Ig-like domain-containing protein n=1 Tax=Holothuria leucospilota TaxID=206669 RepID=A0A9Q1BVI3_HOLLE|nr:hypothetical protein HOLleu_23642 [Holothuria leucospilota]